MKEKSRGRIPLTLCVLVGLFLLMSGVLVLFVRPAAEALFDLHGGNSISGNPLASAVGIRQLAIGSMIILLALVPLADFLSFSGQIGVVSALRHGGTVPLVAGLGASAKSTH